MTSEESSSVEAGRRFTLGDVPCGVGGAGLGYAAGYALLLNDLEKFAHSLFWDALSRGQSFSPSVISNSTTFWKLTVSLLIGGGLGVWGGRRVFRENRAPIADAQPKPTNGDGQIPSNQPPQAMPPRTGDNAWLKFRLGALGSRIRLGVLIAIMAALGAIGVFMNRNDRAYWWTVATMRIGIGMSLDDALGWCNDACESADSRRYCSTLNIRDNGERRIERSCSDFVARGLEGPCERIKVACPVPLDRHDSVGSGGQPNGPGQAVRNARLDPYSAAWNNCPIPEGIESWTEARISKFNRELERKLIGKSVTATGFVKEVEIGMSTGDMELRIGKGGTSEDEMVALLPTGALRSVGETLEKGQRVVVTGKYTGNAIGAPCVWGVGPGITHFITAQKVGVAP